MLNPYTNCLVRISENLILSLGDMVRAAEGDYGSLAATGGVLAIHIQWICNLDLDFMENCLPK